MHLRGPDQELALRAALGCTDLASVPSVHACYRFAGKLRTFKPLMDACVDRLTAALHDPDSGRPRLVLLARIAPELAATLTAELRAAGGDAH